MNKDKIILDLCGGTGEWAKPYKEAGYKVKTITLPDYSVDRWSKFVIGSNKIEPTGIVFYHSDDKTKNIYAPFDNIYGIIAAPPCTMFLIARNDKTAKEPRNLRKGMEIVDCVLEIVRECLYHNYRKDNIGLKFWALENPTTGYLQRFLGKAPLQFNPCDYGDPYTKKTSLWGEFNEPNKNPVEPTKTNFVKFAATDDDIKNDKLSRIPEGYQKKTGYDTRKIIRGITPKGFAKAFFEANR